MCAMMSIASSGRLLHIAPSTGWNGMKINRPMQDRCCEQPIRSCSGIATKCFRGESTSFCWQPEAAQLSRAVFSFHSRHKHRLVSRRSSRLRSSLGPWTNSCLIHRPHTGLVISSCSHPPGRCTALATDSPAILEQFSDEQDYLKAGGGDLRLVQLQASKHMDQPKIADKVSCSL